MGEQSRANVMRDLAGYFKDQELRTLLMQAKQNSQRNYILLRLLAVTGRRVTEVVGRKSFKHTYKHYKTGAKITRKYPPILGLTPADIDWDEQLIAFNILKKKSAYRRLKAIDKQTLHSLGRYILDKKIGLHERIFPISRQRVFQIVQKYAEQSGITLVGTKKPHPHHLRHTFSIRYLRKNRTAESIRRLQMALEHSSLDMTSQYLQFTQEDEKENITKVAEDLG